MTTSPLKFRNILGELTVSKLYGGEHLGVTAPANFDLRDAIALSKSIQIGEPDQQIELAKASGWGTLTDIWVGANHQGNTWQYQSLLCRL